VLNGAFQPGQVYAGSLIAWAGILPLIAALRYHSVGGARGGAMLADIRSGISYARATRAISAVLVIVFIVQLLGMPVATPLGPMFMIDVLHFSTSQVGFMGATWGAGAFAASIAFTRLRSLALRGITLASISLLFGVTVVGFGWSRVIPVTAFFDFGMGFSFTATMLAASTLVQHLVDDRIRGRVMSLFPFSLGLAYVCTAGIGLVGQEVGLAVLIPALGWMTVAACLAVVLWYRQLLGARIRVRASEAAETATGTAAGS
jgi:hypothetical protein